MPNSPFPIGGKIYDIDRVTPKSNVVISAYNETKDESLTVSSTTNSLGEYTLELANATTQWQVGDTIVLTAQATGSDKIRMVRFTIAVGETSHYRDMTLTYFDVLGLVKEILENNWKAGNTETITPKIEKRFYYKRTDFSANNDWIFVYEPLDSEPEPNSIGDLTQSLRQYVAIDIRINGKGYSDGRKHSIKVRNEAGRILNSKIVEPCNGYNLIEPDRNWKDLSDKSNLLYRWLLQTEVTILNMSRTTHWIETA